MRELLPTWKVGDIVRIREDLSENTPDPTHCGLMDDMLQYRGQIHTVKIVGNDRLNVRLDGTDNWWWAPHWLEPITNSDDDIADLPPLDSVL